MWEFKARYVNMENGEKITRKIEFDGDNFFDTEEQCYVCAIKMALKIEMKTNAYTL